MKAVVVTTFGGPETMQVADLDMPSIGANEVLIRVVATSVNFADIKARYGQKGGGKLPFVPGLDAAGVIERVGAEASDMPWRQPQRRMNGWRAGKARGR